MQPILIDGKVMVPKRADGPGGAIGDGYVEMSSDDPDYALVRAWLEQKEAK